MSVVEDARKVLQDFLAPEMRATITKGKLAGYEARAISKESQQ